MLSDKGKNNSSFTLIELLVVLALVAILSVVVVMTLNPAELIKQARDSNRLSDLSTINTALNLFSADVTSGFMGTSTVVYVSIPDNASSTCGSLGLPALPAGWNYNCVTTTNLRNTDGTGWIPVNFQRISSNSPISQLPIDPQNTTSTKYYTYVTGGSWKVIATPESQKYIATAGTDGGTNIGQFEVGNNMSLAPFADGLVGWWKFDEGSGVTAADSSGYGFNAAIFNTPTWVAGKGGSAISLNGTNQYASSTPTLTLTSYTWSVWIKTSSVGGQVPIMSNRGGGGSLYFGFGGGANFMYDAYCTTASVGAGITINNNSWHLISYIINRTENSREIYVDGSRAVSISAQGCGNIGSGFMNFGFDQSNNEYYPGTIDDVRIYNRALSASEVAALYNTLK